MHFSCASFFSLTHRKQKDTAISLRHFYEFSEKNGENNRVSATRFTEIITQLLRKNYACEYLFRLPYNECIYIMSYMLEIRIVFNIFFLYYLSKIFQTGQQIISYTYVRMVVRITVFLSKLSENLMLIATYNGL